MLNAYSPVQRASHVALLTVLLAAALTLPYYVFGAWPFVGRETISAAHMAELLDGLELEDYYAIPREPPDDMELTAQIADFTWCRFCHTLGPDDPHRVGPNLNRILGRPAASAASFAYSRSFVQARENGLVWTPETVDSFIADPHGYVPGNRMRYEPVIDATARQRIVEYLWANSR